MIVAEKLSGLCLVALPCGCQTWARRMSDGRIRKGRSVECCGTGGACFAYDAPPLMMRVGVAFAEAGR